MLAEDTVRLAVKPDGFRVLASAPTQTRAVWPDLLRLIAVFWVVLIHVSAVPVAHFDAIDRSWWWWAEIYNASARTAVPLFVIVSGGLLLSGPWRGLAHFARRRLVKIVPPLIAWTLIYMVWRMLLRGEHFTAGDFLHYLFNGMSDPIYPHLWFLYLILGLYVAVPLLRPVLSHVPNQVLIGFVVLLWLVQIMRLFVEGGDAAYISPDIESFLVSLAYFVFGAAVAPLLPSLSRSQLTIAAIVFVSGISISVLGTYMRTVANGSVLDETLWAPLAPNIMAASAAAYLLIRHIGVWLAANRHSFGLIISQTAGLTFGLYLVHPMVIDIANYMGCWLDPIPYSVSWYVPALSFGVFVASLGVTALLRQVRALTWMLP